MESHEDRLQRLEQEGSEHRADIRACVVNLDYLRENIDSGFDDTRRSLEKLELTLEKVNDSIKAMSKTQDEHDTLIGQLQADQVRQIQRWAWVPKYLTMAAVGAAAIFGEKLVQFIISFFSGHWQ